MAVAKGGVGDAIMTVDVGIISAVGEATAVKVWVGISMVLVGTAVCSGSMLTSNCPQAVIEDKTKNKRSFLNFIGPQF